MRVGARAQVLATDTLEGLQFWESKVRVTLRAGDAILVRGMLTRYGSQL